MVPQFHLDEAAISARELVIPAIPWRWRATFNQRSDQVQKCQMLGMQLAAAQECRDAEIRQATARCEVCFVPDEHVAARGIAAKQPPIAVRANVKLSPIAGCQSTDPAVFMAVPPRLLVPVSERRNGYVRSPLFCVNERPQALDQAYSIVIGGTPLRLVGFVSQLD